MKVTDVRVRVLKPTQHYVKYNRNWRPRRVVHCVVRVLTDEGIEGNLITWLTSADPLTLQSSSSHVKSVLIGKDPLFQEAIYQELSVSRPFASKFLSSAVDCCLWDIAGKAVGLPLYKLFGAYRDKIRAYASTQVYDSIEEYVDLARRCKAEGFTALKIHPWGIPRDDVEICGAVREAVPDMDLMLDAVNAYDRAAALWVGRELERMGFYWYESPLPDEDVTGLAELRRKLSIPIAATETVAGGLTHYPQYLTSGAVDIVRSIGDLIGGITPMKKAAGLCEAFHVKYEIHSLGSALVQAAHLHVMLSIKNSDFFEAPVPQGVLDTGMKDVIRVHEDGCVYAPTKPGLGLDLDWDAIDGMTDYEF